MIFNLPLVCIFTNPRLEPPIFTGSSAHPFTLQDLGGRNLKVNFPTPRGERPAPTERRGGDRGAPRRGPSSPNKVFVGNLSWGMDDMALEDLFSEFGKVLEAKVVTDRETGRSRGFGFVTYASSQEMEEAVANLNGAVSDLTHAHCQGCVCGLGEVAVSTLTLNL